MALYVNSGGARGEIPGRAIEFLDTAVGAVRPHFSRRRGDDGGRWPYPCVIARNAGHGTGAGHSSHALEIDAPTPI